MSLCCFCFPHCFSLVLHLHKHTKHKSTTAHVWQVCHLVAVGSKVSVLDHTYVTHRTAATHLLRGYDRQQGWCTSKNTQSCNLHGKVSLDSLFVRLAGLMHCTKIPWCKIAWNCIHSMLYLSGAKHHKSKLYKLHQA